MCTSLKSLQLFKGATLTWALQLDHLWQISLVDEEKQTASCEQQEEPEGTGHSPSSSTQGVHHHLPLHPQHDAAQWDTNVISSGENQRKKEVGRGGEGGQKKKSANERSVITFLCLCSNGKSKNSHYIWRRVLESNLILIWYFTPLYFCNILCIVKNVSQVVHKI